LIRSPEPMVSCVECVLFRCPNPWVLKWFWPLRGHAQSGGAEVCQNVARVSPGGSMSKRRPGVSRWREGIGLGVGHVYIFGTVHGESRFHPTIQCCQTRNHGNHGFVPVPSRGEHERESVNLLRGLGQLHSRSKRAGLVTLAPQKHTNRGSQEFAWAPQASCHLPNRLAVAHPVGRDAQETASLWDVLPRLQTDRSWTGMTRARTGARV
jgi:hypothetical protein